MKPRLGDNRHALGLRAADETLDPRLLPGIDDRPEIGIVGRKTRLQGGEPLGDARGRLLPDGALHQDAGTGRAGLPRILDDRRDHDGDGRVEIGILEQDLRALATQFQHAADMVPGRRGLDQRAHLRRTREGDEIDPRMFGKGSARLMAEAGNDIDRALGEARLGGEFGNAQHGQAGILGRLQHRGIAHGQSRAKRAAGHLRRIVPGNDMAGDTERLALAGHVVAVHEGNLLAMELVGGAAIELEIAGGGLDIGARGAHRLAAVARLDRRQFLGIVENQLREPHQQAAALGGGEARPGAAFEGCAGRGDGAVDIGGISLGDLGEDHAFRRRDHRQAASRCGRLPAIVDEAAFCGPQRGLTRIVLSHGLPSLMRLAVIAPGWRVSSAGIDMSARRHSPPWHGE